jgi:hypothetical protein
MGPLYDGVAHFGMSPEDILPVVALGLYAGLRGPAAARAATLAVGLGWLLGGAAALSGLAPPAGLLLAVTAALLLGLGGLLAADARTPAAASLVLGAGLGLVRGCADLVGVEGSVPHAGALLGMTACATAGLALAASLTLPLTRFALVIAARVGGSWIAAVGLLLAGWLWRFGAKAL